MSTPSNIDVFIPTFNEEVNLPRAIASVIGWAANVFVVDSESTDTTRHIAESMGAKVVVRPWLGYAKQKNWAIDNLPLTSDWVFILDADEVITDELRDELLAIARRPAGEVPEAGFWINRYFIFMRKRIRHCGFFPSWNLRFFRRGNARYEEREVHEHMIVDGPVGWCKGVMEHDDRRGLEFYMAKHNKYSTLEAREIFKVEQAIKAGTHGTGTTDGDSKHAMRGSFWGGPIERRRWIKHVVYPKLPAKWLFRFLFMYVVKLGFLDGVTGFRFCLFMTAYELLIHLKIIEMRQDAVARRG